MGYAPKHAKPTSLKAARVESRDGAFGIKENRGGSHLDERDAPVSAGLIHSLMALTPLQRQPHARV